MVGTVNRDDVTIDEVLGMIIGGTVPPAVRPKLLSTVAPA